MAELTPEQKEKLEYYRYLELKEKEKAGTLDRDLTDEELGFEPIEKPQVSDGSARIKALEAELAALKEQLAEMKGEASSGSSNPIKDAAQETIHSIKDSVGGAMQHAKDGILGLFDNKKYVTIDEDGTKFDEEDKKLGYKAWDKMTRDELLKARPNQDTSIFIESLEKGKMKLRFESDREPFSKFAKGNRRLLSDMLDHYNSRTPFSVRDVKRLSKKYNVSAQRINELIQGTFLGSWSGLPDTISD